MEVELRVAKKRQIANEYLQLRVFAFGDAPAGSPSQTLEPPSMASSDVRYESDHYPALLHQWALRSLPPVSTTKNIYHGSLLSTTYFPYKTILQDTSATDEFQFVNLEGSHKDLVNCRFSFFLLLKEFD